MAPRKSRYRKGKGANKPNSEDQVDPKTPTTPPQHVDGELRWLEGQDRFCHSPGQKTPSPSRSDPSSMDMTDTYARDPDGMFSKTLDDPMRRWGLPRREYIMRRHPSKMELHANNTSNRSTKKALSVDSPAFTPATLSVPSKTSAISSQAANAAPFTPRGLASGKRILPSSLVGRLTGEGTVTPIPQVEIEPAAFNPAQIKEFTPQQAYDISTNVSLISVPISR
jgi:hypothetical protein